MRISLCVLAGAFRRSSPTAPPAGLLARCILRRRCPRRQRTHRRHGSSGVQQPHDLCPNPTGSDTAPFLNAILTTVSAAEARAQLVASTAAPCSAERAEMEAQAEALAREQSQAAGAYEAAAIKVAPELDRYIRALHYGARKCRSVDEAGGGGGSGYDNMPGTSAMRVSGAAVIPVGADDGGLLLGRRSSSSRATDNISSSRAIIIGAGSSSRKSSSAVDSSAVVTARRH